MMNAVLILLLTYFLFGTDAQEELHDIIAPPVEGNSSQNSGCECVPYYLCSRNRTLITDEVGVIDIHYSDQDDCESYLDVCCNLSDRITIVDEPSRTHLEPKKGCGYRNNEDVGISTIRNIEAQFGEFPWMVAILAEESDAATNILLNVYKCGGALIHPQVILTAAHCVAPQEKKYKVRAGEWDTQTTKEILPHQDRFVKSIVIHSNYSSKTLFNDVAILFLEKPLEIAYNVNTICLLEQDIVVPSGTRCFATGWGKDVFGKEGKYAVVLRKVDYPIVDHSTCQEHLRTTRLGKLFELDKSFVCAGGEEDKDNCNGGGGSPLICPIPGEQYRYQLVGMMAWGISCGQDKIPGVYVNVGLFRHWIDQQIALHGLDVSSYQY